MPDSRIYSSRTTALPHLRHAVLMLAMKTLTQQEQLKGVQVAKPASIHELLRVEAAKMWLAFTSGRLPPSSESDRQHRFA